jgi:drug/metabolite transporter (DMT)-like permease
MKPLSWLGILLAILGVLTLTYQGFNYTRQKRVLGVGPIHATAETHERVFIPPLLGGLALLGGLHCWWSERSETHKFRYRQET